MSDRLEVPKTYKLYINGAFPRSESGRSITVKSRDGRVIAHVCRASRKDLRSAVEAARKAQSGWAARTAYNRGQILYRMAEMLEGRTDEFVKAQVDSGAGERDARAEVGHAVDRLVAFAGWTDKFSQALGCHNPVAGPYYNFTIAEPTGVVAVIAPDTPALHGLISLLAPPMCAGNAVVALGGEAAPVVTSILGEVIATSDVPSGALNLLTGFRSELIGHIASHREIDAIHAAGVNEPEAKTLRAGASENLKRVTVRTMRDESWRDPACESPWWIEPFVEMKTIWSPSGV